MHFKIRLMSDFAKFHETLSLIRPQILRCFTQMTNDMNDKKRIAFQSDGLLVYEADLTTRIIFIL